MVNIIIILSLLHFIFGSYKSNVLNCGLFGFNGPSTLSPELKTFVISNMKILGIMNDSRGGDGAGMYFDSQVLKKGNVKFGNYFGEIRKEMDAIENTSVIFGHSRKCSVSYIKTAENTHPFEIFPDDTKEADPLLVGMHNGTIHNWRDLAKKYDVDLKNINVDSHAILSIIAKQRKTGYKVLEEYYGGAVLVWTFLDEPDALYLFKGASKELYHSKTEEEERPLFFFRCEKTKGIFFSSLEESLEIIRSNDEEIFSMKNNLVFKLKKGKLQEKPAPVQIDRSAVGQKEVFTNTHTRSNTNMGTTTGKHLNNNTQSERGDACGMSHSTFRSQGSTLIKDEPTIEHSDCVVRKDGLYKRNGHEVTGIVFIDKDTSKIVGRVQDGNLILSELEVQIRNYYTTFKYGTAVNHYFFISGIMLKNLKSYIEMHAWLVKHNFTFVNEKSFFSIKEITELSKFAKYPYHYHSTNRLNYLDGKPAKGIEYPEFAENRSYRYEYGRLMEIVKTKVFAQGKLFNMNNQRIFEAGPNGVLKVVGNECDVTADTDEDRIISDSLVKNVTNHTKEIPIITKIEEEMNEELIENAKLFNIAERSVIEAYNHLVAMVKEAKDISKSSMTTKEFHTSTLSGELDSWIIGTIVDTIKSDERYEINPDNTINYKVDDDDQLF